MAIEAALIFPVVMVLALGIVEWSLVLRDQIELTSFSRAGARTASSLAPTHPWRAPVVPFTQQVVDSMERAASSLRGSIDYVLVYEAGADGAPLGGAFTCAGAEGTCDRYDWDPSAGGGQGAFVATTGSSWTGADINACQGDPDMTDVGLFVSTEHDMITGIFGSSKELTAFTVMRFEPQRAGRCRP